MSVTTSIGRPRSASVCQAEANRSSSASTNPPAPPLAAGTPRPSPFSGRGTGSTGAASSPNHLAIRPFIHMRAKDIAIDQIECLIIRRRPFRRQKQVPRQLPRVGHIGQPVPLRRRPRKPKRSPDLPAQRRIHVECAAHVHRVAHREADHRVRSMHALTEPIFRRGGEHFVLLRVVEVPHVDPPLLLPERRLRQRAAPVSLDGPR